MSPDFHYVERIDYESQQPGLGVGHKYQGSAGTIDIYIYDLGQSWQTGVNDPAFGKHFLSTIEEVKYFAQRGAYKELLIGSIQDVSVAGQRFRSVSFRFLRDGRQMESLTFLTAVNGKLLKYRMSLFAPASFEIKSFSEKFIEDTINNPRLPTRT